MGRTREVFDILNKERKSIGLKPAKWNQSLFWGCKEHTKEMLNGLGLHHASPSDISNGGECIWGGYGKRFFSARVIAKGWMKSSGHATLILHPDVSECAVAILNRGNRTYATWRGIRGQGISQVVWIFIFIFWILILVIAAVFISANG